VQTPMTSHPAEGPTPDPRTTHRRAGHPRNRAQGTRVKRPIHGGGPAERVDGYASLRSYGAIGDGRTVALIALDGSIDWLPLPSLREVPVFARLLDAENGGYFELRPSAEFSARRRYVPRTNVLETTFTTETGVVRVTDALVTGIAGRLPWTELARRIDGVRGTVAMEWAVQPGTVGNTASPWVETTPQGPVAHVDGVLLAVRGLDHGPTRPKTDGMRGKFTTSKGSRHLVALSACLDEPLRVLTPELVDAGVDRTIKAWRAWSREFSFEGGGADAALRSALALKLLIFSPSGSIAAAATTSLPESSTQPKNWDYRFAWVRDVAYSIRALVRFGLREETHAAVSWLVDTIKQNGPELSILYGLDGSVPSDEITEWEVPGWRNHSPVVAGNRAQGQLQLGVFGDLFDVMLTYVNDGNVIDSGTARMLTGIADRTCDRWRQPDSGMWELEEVRHYTSSKMGCWQALDRATQLAEAGQLEGDADRWRAEAANIRDWIERNGWSETRGSYVMYPGTDDLDTSVLLHCISGFDRGPRMVATIDAIRSALGRGPLVYRYDGMQDEEGTFVASAFWVASALACVGRIDEAQEQLDALVALSNDVGLFSEQMDERTHEFLGNLPQALSHLALINAVLTIDELGSGATPAGQKRSRRR
jgi:GH15 family glucan-1,4-alpha-glucosidase